MTNNSHNRPAGDMAAIWFGRLRGPISDTERAAFEEWRANPENAQAYALVEQTWDQSMFLANTPIGRGRDLERARSRTLPRRAIAAGLATLLVGLGCWSLLDRSQASRSAAPQIAQASEYEADGSALRIVPLPDGSRLTLDRETAVRIAFSAGERRLTLVRGRARFDVAHDRRRPFVVDAGDGRIVAHGTVFDVAFEGPAVRVLLVRGRVEVRRERGGAAADPRSRMLAPGQELLIGARALAQPSTAPAEALDWTRDMIVFRATRLSDAIASFNRTSPRPIRLEAPGVAERRLSGAFRRGDPDAFAQGVAASFGLAARRGADGILILTPQSVKGP